MILYTHNAMTSLLSEKRFMQALLYHARPGSKVASRDFTPAAISLRTPFIAMYFFIYSFLDNVLGRPDYFARQQNCNFSIDVMRLVCSCKASLEVTMLKTISQQASIILVGLFSSSLDLCAEPTPSSTGY